MLADHQLTNAGRNYLRNAQLGQHVFHVHSMQVGSGVVTNLPNGLWPLTALVSRQLTIPVINWEAVEPGVYKVTGSLSSLNVPPGGSFRLNEVGVMVGNIGNTLYTVANTGSDTGDVIPDSNAPPRYDTLEVYIRIDRVQNITINVQPVGDFQAVNRGEATIGPGPYIERVGDVLHFKRFVAGDRVTLNDTGNTIEISSEGAERLEQDLDIYVPNNYPGLPPDALRFNNINLALAYLAPIIIPPDRWATIHLSATVHTYNSSITVNHPNGDRIRILGAPLTDRVLTSRVSLNENNGNEVIGLNNNSDFVVNDYALIRNDTNGVNDRFTVRGFWPVRNVGIGNQITIYNSRVDFFQRNNSSYNAGTVNKMRTILQFSGNNTDGFIIRGAGLGLLDDVGIVRNNNIQQRTAITCIRGDTTIGAGVGINGWFYGIFMDQAASVCRASCAISNSDSHGVYIVRGATIQFDGISNGNGGKGIYLFDGAQGFCDGATCCGNWLDGFHCFRASGIINNGTVVSQGKAGIVSENHSRIGCNGCFVGDSSEADVFATGISFIGAVGLQTYGIGTGSIKFDPSAANGQGNVFSWINRNQ